VGATTQERKLAAILSADVVGYSRLMAEDEAATIRTLTMYRDQIATLVREHRGRVVDAPGDNLLAEFPTALDAVQAAVEIQRILKVRNADLPAERKMEFRVGVHLGDVAIEGERVYGDGVNIAARLEGLADPGGICISGNVYDLVQSKTDLGYDDIGEQSVKNIPKPVRAYRVRMEAVAATPEVESRPTRRIGPVVAVVLGVGAVAAALWGVYLRPTPVETPGPTEAVGLELPDRPSIAVLPFANMSGDPEQEYFSDGISEDLITDLSRISGLFVIARNSSFVYKGRPVSVPQVGRELGVRYVLEGSVRKANDRLRITAQLVDTTTGGHVWAERYDRQLEDIFALQDEVTGKIVDALEVSLTKREQAGAEDVPTDNLEAYDSYLRGNAYFRHQTKESTRQAREMFEKAIELDPEFAWPHGMLALVYFQEWWNQWTDDPRVVERGFGFAQQSMVLDDSTAFPYVVLSWINFLANRRHRLAISQAEKAISLSPNHPMGYAALANALTHSGYQKETIRAAKAAIRLDPHNVSLPELYLCNAYRLLRRYEDAIAACTRSINALPDYLTAHLVLAVIHVDLDEMQAAKRETAEVMRISPRFSLKVLEERLPYKDPALTEHMIAALRKAGLPEE
jgi:adenylate cyclase